jgi:hypothetical protein
MEMSDQLRAASRNKFLQLIRLEVDAAWNTVAVVALYCGMDEE